MQPSYRAVLRGDRVEWIDPPPRLPGDTEVLITFLHPKPEEVRRRSAVAALEELARRGAFDEIEDPVAWQREIRQDRPLPGREE